MLHFVHSIESSYFIFTNQPFKHFKFMRVMYILQLDHCLKDFECIFLKHLFPLHFLKIDQQGGSLAHLSQDLFSITYKTVHKLWE